MITPAKELIKVFFNGPTSPYTAVLVKYYQQGFKRSNIVCNEILGQFRPNLTLSHTVEMVLTHLVGNVINLLPLTTIAFQY